MRHWSLILLLSCMTSLSLTAQAEDAKPTASAFENFQQIQTIIKTTYCPEEMYKGVQEELVKMSEKDQSDRMTSDPKKSENDVIRRVRVAEISARGCLKNKDDYYAAGLILQHGTLPEHYLQAIMYTSKSVELGNPAAEALRIATIDRYLMSLGYKQIFGTQIIAPAYYKAVESEEDLATCLWPIDKGINLLEDYRIYPREFREMLIGSMMAKKKQFPECDFPARDPSAMLTMLLDTKI